MAARRLGRPPHGGAYGQGGPDRDLYRPSPRDLITKLASCPEICLSIWRMAESQNFRAEQVGGCRLALNNRPPFSSVCSRRFQSFTERDSCVSLAIYLLCACKLNTRSVVGCL